MIDRHPILALTISVVIAVFILKPFVGPVFGRIMEPAVSSGWLGAGVLLVALIAFWWTSRTT